MSLTLLTYSLFIMSGSRCRKIGQNIPHTKMVIVAMETNDTGPANMEFSDSNETPILPELTCLPNKALNHRPSLTITWSKAGDILKPDTNFVWQACKAIQGLNCEISYCQPVNKPINRKFVCWHCLEMNLIRLDPFGMHPMFYIFNVVRKCICRII